MELSIGLNSYMTLDEANTLVSEMYTSSSPERVLWDSLSDDDKTIYILNATEKVDVESMVYKGVYVEVGQDMQWPRRICGKIVECPNSIKRGLLRQLFIDYFAESSDENRLKEMGVKAFSDGGGARIEFASASDSLSNTSLNKNGISKNIWRQYFSQWSKIIGG